MELTRNAPASTPSMRALALVGRVVTDGVRVGVARHADGPDWFVALNDRGEAVLSVLPDTWAAHSEPEIAVRWHGQNWLTMVPLSKIRKGVTLTK